jgi:hypothetical protein
MTMPMTDEVTLRFTDAEVALISALATARARADAGDRQARARMAQLNHQVVSLARLAKRGNAGAARRLLVLRESGILQRSQSLAMNGPAIL